MKSPLPLLLLLIPAAVAVAKSRHAIEARELFSKPLASSLRAAELPGCKEMFPGKRTHLEYIPARKPRSRGELLLLPFRSFALNGVACDSDPSAEVAFSSEARPPPPGVPPNPFPGIIVNQFQPGELKYLYYGWLDRQGINNENGVLEGIRCGKGSSRTARLKVKEFGIWETAVEKKIKSPIAIPGTPPLIFPANTTFFVIVGGTKKDDFFTCIFSGKNNVDGVSGPRANGRIQSDPASNNPGSPVDRDSGSGKKPGTSKLGVGAIAGIVVSVFVVVLLVAIALTIAHRAAYKRRHSESIGSIQSPIGSEPPSVEFSS